MPVYEFVCRSCARGTELLLPMGGATAEQTCPDCGGTMRRRFGRVAVRYADWGFTATDKLVSDTRGKDYRALRERAERIAEE